MLTRQEREQNVLDLYNQGKTIRDIAMEVRMSFRDISAVLRREEEKEERQKKQKITQLLRIVIGVYLYRLKLTNYSPKVKLP